MSINNLLNLSGDSLANMAHNAKAGPGLSSEQLNKLSSFIEQRVQAGVANTIQKLSAQQQAEVQHAHAVYSRVTGAVDKISSIKALGWLAENGYLTKRSNPQVFEALPQLIKVAEEMEGEIAEAGRSGDAAESALATNLVDSASMDPEEAAALPERPLPLLPYLILPGRDGGLDVAMSDTTPILDHLEQRYPERPLRPADPALNDAEVLSFLKALPGIGPYSAANIMQLLGRYAFLALDTESVRHGRTVLGMTGTDRAILKQVADHFEPFGEHKFRSYWFELWKYYEDKRGPSQDWDRETTGRTFTAALL